MRPVPRRALVLVLLPALATCGPIADRAAPPASSTRPLQEASAQLVRDIHPGPGDGIPEYFADKGVFVRGALLFRADDGVHGAELWRSDGTEGGTWLVQDTHPVGEGMPWGQLLPFGDAALFFGEDALYRSDGTEAGTFALHSFEWDRGMGLGVWGGTAAALVSLGGHATDLWVSDGTVQGTQQRIHGIGWPDWAFGQDGKFIQVGDWLALQAVAAGSSAALYRTDLTAEGTRLLWGGASANRGVLCAVAVHRGVLYFIARDLEALVLWRSDGTPEGTSRVRVLGHGPSSSARLELLSDGRQLFFTGETPETGLELWRSDGTESGTHLLKDIFPGSTGSSPSLFAVHEGQLYFRAADAQSGLELWRSDGTEEGTRQVLDLAPGSSGGLAAAVELISHPRGLLFRGDDGVLGEELWLSRGSAQSTWLVADTAPGAASSSPRVLAVAEDHVYFTATTQTVGRELWTVRLPEPLSEDAGVDGGTPDAGPADAGASDAGWDGDDAGLPPGHLDGGAGDGGLVPAAPDAGSTDAGSTDAGAGEVGGESDAGGAATPGDAGAEADAGPQGAGGVEPPPARVPGGACSAAGSAQPLLASMLLLLGLSRRRRAA